MRAASALETYLAEHHAETAALIVEPLVQGAAGMGCIIPTISSLRARYAMSTRYTLSLTKLQLALAEQEQCLRASRRHIVPDFLCLGKGLSAGYLPLSVVMTTDGVYQAFYHDETARGFLHSHTHAGNALACRAALATLDIFEQDKIIEANRVKANYLNQAVRPITYTRKSGIFAIVE